MKKILLVEDDEFLGIILSDHLQMNGFKVNLLRLPAKAVENLQNDSFDLVIMDKRLNGLDGTLICAAIRNTDNISDIPIMMMSGEDGAKEDCLAAGANHFLPKPFDVESLLKGIDATIKKAKEHQE
ncbi:response regulator [Antarcticibacterium sp. 1MA-6-2]|uniref:response regulator n=1 Tax=Antarcticibacterium sp. 1MA-6-2 TaxID=2908210 RepID=UPI001F32B80E|nr:response regulator [Antarcticibacterium sp. 1MA-6-2]UJH92453.1 response regulator [Antarcticibacterium sp. 1MA-6-2]